MKAIIVDDERLARDELSKLLDKYDSIEIIDNCGNADEAIESINSNQPDVIFLDINMPGKNGFDLLSELDAVPLVVFVTAYDEYAIKAFEVSAMDYLLKPVDSGRLNETIEKIKELIDTKTPENEFNKEKLTKNDQIFIKDRDKCWFVRLQEIRMFESEGNYVRVYFDGYKPLILKSLNSLEEKIDDELFFRANRKILVNLSWINKIDNWFNGGLKVELKTGEIIEISRRQASRFKDLKSL